MSEEGNSIRPDSYSVKTTTEITARIQELIKKTGLNHKDLFAAIVTRYYTELEAGSELDRSDDMQQIRYHLNRVENIFLGSLQKVQDLKKDYCERLDSLKIQHKETQEELHKKSVNLSEELEKSKKINSENENLLKKARERNSKLEEAYQGNQMTIKLLGQQIEEFKVKASKLDSLESEIKNLQDKIFSDQQKLTSLHSELETAQQTIADDNQLQMNMEKTFKEEKEKLKQNYNKDVQQLKEVHKLEVDKVLLESERRILETVQKVKDEYQAKIDALVLKNDDLKLKNQDLTEKIYSLEINELRKEKLSEKLPEK